MNKLYVLLLCVCIVVSGIIIYSEKHTALFKEQEEEKESGVAGQMFTWWQSRAYPDPYNIDAKYQRACKQAEAMKRRSEEILSGTAGSNGSNGIVNASGSWTSLGPNQTIGGRVLSIAIDPGNTNNIFIGTASGGIWKSSNAGTSWSHVTTGFYTLGVASIIIDPSNSNVIYAGTGEVYRADSTGATANPGNTGFNVWKTRGTYGVGILKSTNGGSTWSQVLIKTLPNLFAIQSLRFDPNNSSIVYAATTDGLYRTTDAGATWNKILNYGYTSDVLVNAKNSSQIVAAVGNLQNSIKGIYRSTDNGATWTHITTGLPASYQGFIKMANVTSLGNRDTIIASIGVSEVASTELYRSTDFGNTWAGLTSSAHTKYQYWCAHNVAINPSNTTKLLFAGVNSYRYTLPNSGGSGIGGIHSDVHDIKFDPTNGNIAYIACDGGMYKSINAASAGPTFSTINSGLGAVQFYSSLGVSAQDPNMIVGGLQDNGVIMYNGATWTTLGWIGGDGTACAIDPTNDNNVIGCRDAKGIYTSGNRGASGSNTGSYWGSVADSRTAFAAPITWSKSNPSIVYVASDNIHKSSDGGNTWSNDSYSSATQYIDALHKTGIAIAVSPVNANKIYVSTSPFAQYDNDVDNLYVTGTPNVLRSINGSTFSSIKGSLPDRYVMDFAISSNSDDSVWIVLGGFGTSHLYVTGNGGASWVSKDPGPGSGGLPDVPANAVLIDPRNPNYIYVGNDLGVYVSPDRGTTWLDFNYGLWDATQIVDLQPTPDGKKLRAATHGKGVFESPTYNTLLPSTITDFKGQYKNDRNELQWTTTNESGVLRYELQKSTDGSSFNAIATFGANNRPGTNAYAFNDVGKISGIGIYYYRLKIINQSNDYSYSRVIAIRQPSNDVLQVVNPVSGNVIRLTVKLDNPQKISLNLYDASGRLCATGKYNCTAGLNPIAFDKMNFMANGTYVMEAVIGKDKYRKRLIKQ